jgi:D-alanyl-D-alanine endopeptidase (penicillin-binding protein 7)
MTVSKSLSAKLICFVLLLFIAVPGFSSSKSKMHKKTVAKTAQRSSFARPRRTKSLRVKAALYAKEVAHTQLPRFKVEENGDVVPDLHAAAAVIFDPETQQIIWEENAKDQRSIASITKIMTAVVFMESVPDLDDVITIERSDVSHASTTYLHSKDKVTVRDLLHLLLIPSDNAAARALARVSQYGSVGFVNRMNEKAAELGLENTHYADPSGLLSDNLSSAFDMARLITYATSNEMISSIMRTSQYSTRTPRRTITVRSTDHLLGRGDIDVRAAKTGYISRSGYCLATILRVPQSGQQYAVVVLGAHSNAGRFLETQNLYSWISTRPAPTMDPALQSQATINPPR